MKLNREQIKKALECCASEEHVCDQCPIDEKIKDDCECGKVVARNALALIKELAEKVENYRQELGEVRVALAEANNDKKKLSEENERLKVDNGILKMPRATIFEIADAFERGRTDGVWRMQERLLDELYKIAKVRHGDESNMKSPEVFRIIDQITKEMLEATKCPSDGTDRISMVTYIPPTEIASSKRGEEPSLSSSSGLGR